MLLCLEAYFDHVSTYMIAILHHIDYSLLAQVTNSAIKYAAWTQPVQATSEMWHVGTAQSQGGTVCSRHNEMINISEAHK